MALAASGGTINHIGNIVNLTALNCITGPGNSFIYTYNHTGDIYGGIAGLNTGGAAISSPGGFGGTTLNYNCTGNVFAGTSPALYLSGANINIVGNVTGTSDRMAINLIGGSGVSTIVNVNGVITAGANQPAIVGIVTTLVKVQGTVINQGTYNAIYAGRITLEGNIAYWQYRNELNNTSRNLYTVNNLNYPSATNVRNGITYGVSSELTGTAYIPLPANVLQGVPVDNTTGTYSTTPALIANEIFTKLLSSTDFNTSGSFGKLVKDNLDAQVSSRLATSGYTTPPTVTQIRTEMDTNSTKLDVAVSTRLASASYVAPDNADIAAIKAVTDTLTDVATETTSLAIKTRTDLIPNNPASVDAVGAIVASYNV